MKNCEEDSHHLNREVGWSLARII